MNKVQIRNELIQVMRQMENYIDNGGDYTDATYQALDEKRNELRRQLFESDEGTSS